MTERTNNELLKVMVVDDEEIACHGVRMLLESDPDLDVVAVTTDPKEAIGLIRKFKPDLLFLDIQMPKISGFELIESISVEEMPFTVFTTAYDQFALKAFEVNAIDYLLKPFDDFRFGQALAKAKSAVRGKKSTEFRKKMETILGHLSISKSEEKRYLKRLIIRGSGEMVFINTADIRWILAEDYYVFIHTRDKKYLMRETLNNLELQLDPSQFLRIHRSTIISIDSIRSVKTWFNGELMVVTHSGEKFRVSRSRKEALRYLPGV